MTIAKLPVDEPLLMLGNCVDKMGHLPDNCIDLTVTSPPYDNLRTYDGYSFDFEGAAKEIYRITKEGGVVVWIVGDSTVKGTESGTSFKQALFFKEIGFNLHDTMIWEKTGRLPTQDRYYNIFEYMFVFSKGRPRAMNFICDHRNVNGGRVQQSDTVINKGKNIKSTKTFVRPEFSRRPNIWKIHVGINKTEHPAVFPEQLALDHISTWSNEGDVVLDPFLGSGTTGKAATTLNRKFIGIELSENYMKIARSRIAASQRSLAFAGNPIALQEEIFTSET